MAAGHREALASVKAGEAAPILGQRHKRQSWKIRIPFNMKSQFLVQIEKKFENYLKKSRPSHNQSIFYLK